MQRRNFIKGGVMSIGAATAGGVGLAPATAAPGPGRAAPSKPDGTTGSLDPRGLPRVSEVGERRGDMLYRSLGRTGEKVSLIGMGGAHLSRKPLDEAKAVKLIHAAIDRGINFLDNCWDYGNGNSEKWMGTA